MRKQSKSTILSIDDERDFLTASAACLEDHGYRVVTADSGQEGLRLFEKSKPDLVLVDLRMPDVSGLDVIAHIKTHSPDTPVIVLSATGILHDAMTSLRMGAWDYLTKPIESKELLYRTIERSLEKAKLKIENKKYYQNIERMLDARTTDLHAARNAAQAASRVKEEFLANMSHEFRTPLSSILGYTDLLLTSKLDLEHQEYLEVIRRSSHELLSILSGILDLTKIKTDQLELKRETFTPRRLAEEALSAIKTSSLGKPISFGLEIDSSVPESLIGDPFHLKRILLNLLDNAVRFTPKGEVRLKVEREKASLEDDDRECLLRFSVIDTGIGIPKELHEKIFEPFTQADNSPTRNYSGVGLGLTICRRMIEKLGGKIWVVSNQGQGSAFHFMLPLTLPSSRNTVNAR